MNEDEMRELANDPSNVVMAPTYENVYEPWKPDKIRECIGRIVTISEDCNSSDEVDAKVKEDPELFEFARLHKIIYKEFQILK